jgi:PEP-CTERM motif-containing protein
MVAYLPETATIWSTQMRHFSTVLRGGIALIFLILACVGGSSSCASAAIIFQMTRVEAGGGGISPPNVTIFAPIITEDDRSHANQAIIFGFPLTPANVGQTFVANAQTEQSFSRVARSLTDGLDQLFQIVNQGSNQHNFFSNVPGGNGVDLGGFRLDAIRMTFVSRMVEIPGSDPNHDGSWEDHTNVFEYVYEGVLVPEPSSFVLAALGLIGLAAWGWRRCG